MKKTLAIVISLMFIFALTAVSFAADKAAAPAAAPAEKKEAAPAEKKVSTKQVTGEVTAVDAAGKTITVKGKKGDVVIGVDDKTLADVKAGDRVTAKYTSADNKNTAKSVKKAKTAAKKEKKAETKEAAPAAAKPAAK